MSYEVAEFHQQGSLGISNHAEVITMLRQAHVGAEQVDVGLQVGPDGRIWICINGMAFLRFKPGNKQMYIQPVDVDSHDHHPRCHPGDCDGDGLRCGFSCHVCS